VANVLDDLATRIATTISGTVGTNVFKTTMPVLPDAAVALHLTGGLAPEKRFGSAGVEWERPSVRIDVRGAPKDTETALATSQTIFEDVSEIETEDLSGTRYYLSDPQQQPFPISVDEQDRPTVAFNIILTKDKNA
jgi:hypothetical protein